MPPPPAVVTGTDVRASAWLQRLHPERYAALTPAALHAIAELDLRGCEITDADVALLAALPNLASLELRGNAVTDAGLPAWAGYALPPLSRLRHLEIDGTQVTVAGVERLLQRYPLLTRIEARGVPLAPETLAELGRRFPK